MTQWQMGMGGGEWGGGELPANEGMEDVQSRTQSGENDAVDEVQPDNSESRSATTTTTKDPRLAARETTEGDDKLDASLSPPKTSNSPPGEVSKDK